ncbi:hypothetical protein LC040_07295 [Bacillus tianshenii]|nr:hypothetical protein LC040_07295 [Bacillus tianshenii]
MNENFSVLEPILNRTKDAVQQFMGIITPVIEDAKDEHERLYWHHIYEEEEHRLDRLNVLLPKIVHMQASEQNKGELVRLLQDISLEKFGLHNFLEHLDLSLFQFKETEHGSAIQTMRDMTAVDYHEMKGIMNELNSKYEGTSIEAATPTDEKEGAAQSLKAMQYVESDEPKKMHPVKEQQTKRLTVGSLKK